MVFAAGCSGAEVAKPTGPAEIVVSATSATLESLGESIAIVAMVRNSDGKASTAIVGWHSADPSIATVSNAGSITAVSNGATTVTASSGSISKAISVTVSQKPTQLAVFPATLNLLAPGPSASLTAPVTDARGNSIAAVQVTWSSSNESVALVSPSGVVSGIASGTATISARLGSLLGSATITVRQDGVVVAEAIDPFLASPASNHQWEIPVLVIRYLPTTDGLTLDQRVTAFPFPATQGSRPATLSDVRKRIDVYDRRVKFMLEEGSRFRGYANPQALPALGYRILHYLTVYEPLPLGRVAGPCPPSECTGNAYFPDYHAILARVNAEHWVNTRGVQEIWVWGYHYGTMVQPESNMASPTTGDVSNSFRWNDDLPIYNRTYTLYGYNFSRSQNEAVHNHGHQLEAILGYADERQNGTSDLFWRSFVGRSANGFITGRAGWTHMPPNTTQDYDYFNPTPVVSDIDDWRPDNTGAKTAIGSDRWRNLVYNWPPGDVPLRDGRTEDFAQGSDQRTEAQWYVYWMQNMPGRGSAIPHNGGQMTNWWNFTANWDTAIPAGTGLSTVRNGLAVAIRNDYVGSVLLDPGGTILPGQTITISATDPITVRLYNCGGPGGCKMDPYVLTPGKNYRVITHPNGPAANITIVEQ
jgi:hypothetical protein